jgi:hypothetical protein
MVARVSSSNAAGWPESSATWATGLALPARWGRVNAFSHSFAPVALALKAGTNSSAPKSKKALNLFITSQIHFAD